MTIDASSKVGAGATPRSWRVVEMGRDLHGIENAAVVVPAPQSDGSVFDYTLAVCAPALASLIVTAVNERDALLEVERAAHDAIACSHCLEGGTAEPAFVKRIDDLRSALLALSEQRGKSEK